MRNAVTATFTGCGSLVGPFQPLEGIGGHSQLGDSEVHQEPARRRHSSNRVDRQVSGRWNDLRLGSSRRGRGWHIHGSTYLPRPKRGSADPDRRAARRSPSNPLPRSTTRSPGGTSAFSRLRRPGTPSEPDRGPVRAPRRALPVFSDVLPCEPSSGFQALLAYFLSELGPLACEAHPVLPSMVLDDFNLKPCT